MTRRTLAPLARRALGASLAILSPLACARRAAPAATLPAPAEPSAAAAPAPKLIVQIVVDQMRPDYFDRYGAQLQGGLKRLWDGGAVFTDAHQDHAITETAPGHAATQSGRFPAHTGIVLNDEGVQDPQAPLIGSADDAASPYRFRGSVLTDWLRTENAASRALSVSRKDRGAILPIGRAKQSVFWYSTDAGFTTSRYYGDTLPAWVRDFNRRNPIAGFAGRQWELLRDPSWYTETDSVPQEHRGRDFTFPHLLPTERVRLGAELKEVPWMDSLTVLLALDGVRTLHLGEGPQTDVLNVSLSTLDAVGHRYGPDSRELHDMFLRVDQYVGMLLDSLSTWRDPATIAIVLTADHGVGPVPGVVTRDPSTAGRYVNDTALVTPERRLAESRGLPADAVRCNLGMVRLDRAAFRGAGVDVDSLVDAMARRLRATPGLERVDTPAALARADTVHDRIAREWLHSLAPDEPVVLAVTPSPWAVWSRVNWNPANHGSPQRYDTHVPLVFYGSWFRAGNYPGFTRVVDIAPTLAAVAHVAPTEKLDGRVLREALRDGTANGTSKSSSRQESVVSRQLSVALLSTEC